MNFELEIVTFMMWFVIYYPANNTEHTSSQESVETSIAKRHTHF